MTDKRTNKNYKGDYYEHLFLEDGTETKFRASLGSDKVYNSTSKNGISFTEETSLDRGSLSDLFEKYAQPSKELLNEYAIATGLPAITKSFENSLCSQMKRIDENSTFPFIISLKAQKEIDGNIENKSINYAYSSIEAYKNGDKPYMIHMDGIDGRSGASGMFRLKGDSYIDNSSFRRENGKYTFDTLSYEDVLALAGKMPTSLSQRANSVITNEFKIPTEIQEIYDKSIAVEKEAPDKDSQSIS